MTTDTLQSITLTINSASMFPVMKSLKFLQHVGWTVYVLSLDPSKPGTDNAA
jgi:hypothetical protein